MYPVESLAAFGVRIGFDFLPTIKKASHEHHPTHTNIQNTSIQTLRLGSPWNCTPSYSMEVRAVHSGASSSFVWTCGAGGGRKLVQVHGICGMGDFRRHIRETKTENIQNMPKTLNLPADANGAYHTCHSQRPGGKTCASTQSIPEPLT